MNCSYQEVVRFLKPIPKLRQGPTLQTRLDKDGMFSSGMLTFSISLCFLFHRKAGRSIRPLLLFLNVLLKTSLLLIYI